MKDYHINVFHSEEDDGYIADIPDLKYCSACGDTPERLCDRCKSPKKPGFRPEKKAARIFPSRIRTRFDEVRSAADKAYTETTDESLEPGLEKVAIFADSTGGPTLF